MNKRILELYKLAHVPHKEIDPSNNMPYDSTRFSAEKFAELIVRTCAELSVNSQYTNTKSEYYEGFNEALVYVGIKIKEHFGVKE